VGTEQDDVQTDSATLENTSSTTDALLSISTQSEGEVSYLESSDPLILEGGFEVQQMSSPTVIELPVRTRGSLTFQRWNGIAGTEITDLTSNSNYPNSPDVTQTINSTISPIDDGDNYGARFVGYLIPKRSGLYTFWITGNDKTSLRISTDDSPANAQEIAHMPDWTLPKSYDNRPIQESNDIPLEANKAYYFEAIMKEGTGGDHMSVAWRGLGISERTEITGDYFAPLGDGVTPIAFFDGPDVIPEMSEARLDLSLFDAPTADAGWNWVIDWGDGYVQTVPGSSQSSTNVYGGSGAYQVTVSLEASIGGQDYRFLVGTHTINVAAGTPTVITHGEAIVSAGETYSLDVEVPISSAGPVSAWRVDWGDGTSQNYSGLLSTITHEYNVAGTYQIQVLGYNEEYTLGEYQEENGMVEVEAELFSRQVAGINQAAGMEWGLYEEPGFGGGGVVVDVFGHDTNVGDSLDGPRLDYDINFDTTGTYYVWQE